MKFREEEVDNFLNAFKSVEHHIRNFNGCKGLQLLQQTDDPSTLFTYSLWDSEESLHHYRFSELFKNTWAKNKNTFR